MRNRLHCLVALVLGLALTGTALALTLPAGNTVKSPAKAACCCPEGTCPADGSCCGCAGGIQTAAKKAACCCPEGTCPSDGSCCGCSALTQAACCPQGACCPDGACCTAGSTGHSVK